MHAFVEVVCQTVPDGTLKRTRAVWPLGQGGMHHSDKMHIEERFHLTGPDKMEIRTTITDPVALTKPWTSTKTLARHRDWDIAEYVCEQNNRNSVNEAGKAGINLDK